MKPMVSMIYAFHRPIFSSEYFVESVVKGSSPVFIDIPER